MDGIQTTATKVTMVFTIAAIVAAAAEIVSTAALIVAAAAEIVARSTGNAVNEDDEVVRRAARSIHGLLCRLTALRRQFS